MRWQCRTIDFFFIHSIKNEQEVSLGELRAKPAERNKRHFMSKNGGRKNSIKISLAFTKISVCKSALIHYATFCARKIIANLNDWRKEPGRHLAGSRKCC